ncbi:hypothetical protein BCR34DRAFT_490279 [Clohesyomyces aquaticus]|uniref:Uncharacterized protein n=1 Tax=Clohesyomyces aquaticus TaxID=1231657 RepID=A0A1Y1Z7J1_9PLEO|nr:hypothetical protein BCR34DRAFT_490279 [Clohesyomyces aquaticus]
MDCFISWYFFLLLPIFVPRACGLRTFRPNCGTPPEGVGFVQGVNIRSTLDIVWGCLFTLLICTWTVQHLNLPPRRNNLSQDEEQGKLEKCQAWLSKRWHKAHPRMKWMALTIVLPELLLGKAYQEYIMANRSRDKMRQFAQDDGVEWTKMHGFYANMGGFALAVRGTREGSEKEYVYLNANTMWLARGSRNDGSNKNLLLCQLPHFTEADIEDKSKGDFFIKATAFIQVLWLVIQVIVRGARGLVISPLEFAVIAYSASFFITYLLWWSKPQDVRNPRILRLDEIEAEGRNDPPKKIDAGVQTDPLNEIGVEVRDDALNKIEGERSDIFKPPPNDARYDNAPSQFLPNAAGLTRMDDGIAFGGVVFGALHCAAWNSPFPTPIERLLWRVASVVSAGMLPLYYLILLCDIHTSRPRLVKQILSVLELLAIIVYILARSFLLVEMCRSLGFLPPEAFAATWASEIPHV